MRQQKQVSCELDLAVAKNIVATVASHKIRLTRIEEIMDEITRLKERPDVFVQGGANTSKQEIAERLYQEARRKYYALFETTEAVESVLEDIRQNQENKQLGERLAKAILVSCEHFGEHGFGAETLIRKYRLFMSEKTFKRRRKVFVESVGKVLGYLGAIEFDLYSQR